MTTLPSPCLYAQVGFWAAFGIVHGLQHLFQHLQLLASPRLAAHPSLADRLPSVIARRWPEKLMGYAAAFVCGRRPAKAVFDDLQLWQCERQVLRGRTRPPRYYPPTWRATFHDVLVTAASAAERHGRAPSWALTVLAFVAAALIIEGALVLLVVAPGS